MKKYFLILIVSLVTIPAYADNKEQTIYGKTYGEWSAKWVQWAYAGPDGANAIQDETGEFCTVNQLHEKIWFLAGSFGKTGVVRNCTIPSNRALFYPLIEGGWVDCPGTSDEDQTDAYVRQSIATVSGPQGDNASLLTSTLDSAPIASLQILTVRTQSPKFNAILPVNHVLGDPGCGFTYPAGKTGRWIIDGYWVMLPPLPPGVHVLTLHGASDGFGFDNEVTYNLNVLGDEQDDHHHHK